LAALRAILFSSRKDAETQRNCGALGLTSGGLSVLAASRAKNFFYSRKDAETQRNCGALGMTFRRGGLALQLGASSSFFLLAKPACSRQALERGHACPVRRGVRESDFCANLVQMKKDAF
jgi:hypothetical protein